MASKMKLGVTSVVDEGVPAEVLGDAARLGQVLGNLLTNAVKFTERGKVEVGVSAQRLVSSQIELLFSVHDTGIGIAETEQEQLFDAVYQVDASASSKHGGTGLGLAICRSLSEMMGGAIWVQSTPGEGSTFYFTVVGEVVTASS